MKKLANTNKLVHMSI